MQGTVFSFTSTVAKELGASAFEIGLNTVLFTLVQILSAGFIGKKVLKWLKPYQAVTIGFLLMGLSCLFVAYGDHMMFLYAAQIIGGVSNLMANSVLMSLIIRFVPQENQSTAMGLFQALYGIGMTIGPVMTGQIASVSTYSMAYLVMGIMTLVTAALAPVMLRKMN